MADVVWEPDERKPAQAARLEGEIQKLVPGARVKITLVGGGWRVRALAPASYCSRGAGSESRDVSAAIAEMLGDHGVAAAPFSRERSPLR